MSSGRAENDSKIEGFILKIMLVLLVRPTTLYAREQTTPTLEREEVSKDGLRSSELPPFPNFSSGQPSTVQPTGLPTQAIGTTLAEPPGQELSGWLSTLQPTGVLFTSQSGRGDGGFTTYPGGEYPSFHSTATPLPGKQETDSFATTGYPIADVSTTKPEGGYSFQSTGITSSEQSSTEEQSGSPGAISPAIIDFSTKRPFEQSSTAYSGQQGGHAESSSSGAPSQPPSTTTVQAEAHQGIPEERAPAITEANISEGVTSHQPESVPLITEKTTSYLQPDKSVISGFTPSIPRGFTSSTSIAETETIMRTIPSPTEGITEENEVSQTAVSSLERNATPEVESDDDKHPPHIHAIDVQCRKDMMAIIIEFNREFNGIIYSKGFFNTPKCRYVKENSGQIKYSFTVNLNMCGTEFVNAFDTEGRSYLENILVLQNEAGIQEQWDTVRAVRCSWEGNIKDTLSVAFSIGMLGQEIVAFSGDTAIVKLDVVLGRGPFGAPANGLVKIGENMTLVVSVMGDTGFDLQVKDCKAIDSTGGNTVQLSDKNGCILKPKLFGAFQKSRDTGNTGASVIAFAHFNAFKFPDIMDLSIECNIELCKTNCDICEKEDESVDPVLRRKKRDTPNSTLGEGVLMGKHLRIVLPEDFLYTQQKLNKSEDVCVSLHSFAFSSAILLSLLAFASFTSCCLWLKRGRYEDYIK